MTRKVIITSIVFLFLAVVGGAVSPMVEEWWRNDALNPGQIVVRTLTQEYQAELYDRVVKQAAEERDKPANRDYRPQILYVQWAASRRMERESEADTVKKQFLREYPEHLLAADMHFADAMQLLVFGDAPAAEHILAEIEKRYPGARITGKAQDIRSRLIKASTQPTRHEGT